MEVKEAVKYLNSFTNYEKTTGYSYNAAYFNLDRMRYLLCKLGNPHLKIPSIHITGTKGKGSVANFIASILTKLGLKTGLYTSPHIITFQERIEINGKNITLREISYLADKIKLVIDKLNKNTKYGLPTFFEVYTVLAFLYFYKKRVDIMVLEVGMGGRLDATNVIIPLVSVITPVSLDHIEELGNSVEKIAKEKSGIIKRNVPVISAPQKPSVRKIIKKETDIKGSTYIEVGKHVKFRIIESNANGSVFSLKTPNNVFSNLKIKLIGEHQVLNAVVAITAVEIVYTQTKAKKSLDASIKKGIKDVKIPCRIQVISKRPLVILDVAHNTASVKALKNTIKKYFKYRKLILVLGMSLNKDIKGVMSILIPFADYLILVKSSNYRAATLQEFKKYLKLGTYFYFDNVKDGVVYSKKIAKKNDLICITGSFYVISDYFALL